GALAKRGQVVGHRQQCTAARTAIDHFGELCFEVAVFAADEPGPACARTVRRAHLGTAVETPHAGQREAMRKRMPQLEQEISWSAATSGTGVSRCAAGGALGSLP